MPRAKAKTTNDESSNWTIVKIKEELKKRNISFNSKLRKAELLKLLPPVREEKVKSPSPIKKTKKVSSPQVSNVKKIIPGAKYEYIWQYKSNDGTWENYSPKASDIVEEVYQGYLSNRGDYDVRSVKSGNWEFQVDFLAMKQTNTQKDNHRIRDVRRIRNLQSQVKSPPKIKKTKRAKSSPEIKTTNKEGEGEAMWYHGQPEDIGKSEFELIKLPDEMIREFEKEYQKYISGKAVDSKMGFIDFKNMTYMSYFQKPSKLSHKKNMWKNGSDLEFSDNENEKIQACFEKNKKGTCAIEDDEKFATWYLDFKNMTVYSMKTNRNKVPIVRKIENEKLPSKKMASPRKESKKEEAEIYKIDRDELVKLVGTEDILIELQNHKSENIKFPSTFFVKVDLENPDETKGLQYFIHKNDKEPFLLMGFTDTGFLVSVALMKSIGKKL